jgi:hypothetical protein
MFYYRFIPNSSTSLLFTLLKIQMNTTQYTTRRTDSRLEAYSTLRVFYPQLPKELNVKSLDIMMNLLLRQKAL